MGLIVYKIEYVSSVKDDLKSISKSDKEQIKKAIEKKLATNPIEFGKPLQYSLKGLRRLRVGNYRIIFKIDEEEQTVLIVKIGHRKEVYD
ncbi:MAG: type II toxin-antitoxin system RelE/ParE family toxin [Pseudobdellovibrionaceae bacterium]